MAATIEKAESWLEQHRIVQFCIVAGLFTALVLGVTIGCGTMTSGWHFVDDHEILEWQILVRSVSGQERWESVLSLFAGDYDLRFRPLYYPIRLLTILVVGNNLVVYEVLKAIQAILCLVLLYYVGKGFGGSVGTSFLFSLLSLTGYQAAAWWKLGPQELQGTLYLAIGLLLLQAYLRNGRRMLAILSLASILIMCNWKESFIVLVPFIMLYVVCVSWNRESEETLVRQILTAVRAHVLYLAALAIMLVIMLAIIVFVVGTNNSSGGGVGVPLSTIVSSYQWAFTHDLKYYYAVTLILTAILLTYWERLKGLWPEILLTVVFLLPNLVLYGKEAMAERYIIPSSIGWGLFYIVIVGSKRLLSGKRQMVYSLALLELFALGLRSTIIEADYYRFRGESITQAMEYARTVAEQDATVMECFGYSNPEAEWTIDSWMEYYGLEDHLYEWDENLMSVYESYPTDEDNANKESHSLEEMDVVMAYNSSDRHYTGMCAPIREGMLDEDYTKVTVGSLDVYVRNDSGLALPEGNIQYPYYY